MLPDAMMVCGASLTALIKPGGGFRPIAVGETLHCLFGKVCCLAVRSALPDVFSSGTLAR